MTKRDEPEAHADLEDKLDAALDDEPEGCDACHSAPGFCVCNNEREMNRRDYLHGGG